MRVLLAGCVALSLAGCVSQIAEGKVERGLLRAGLSLANADCMAKRMVDRLSIAQLRKLEHLQARKGEPVRPATLRQFVQRVRRVDDAQVLAVTSSSAALCATGLAHEAQ